MITKIITNLALILLTIAVAVNDDAATEVMSYWNEKTDGELAKAFLLMEIKRRD